MIDRIVALTVGFMALEAATAADASIAVLGADAAACAEGSSDSAALVTVTGFKDRSGNVRVQLYPANKKDFLRSGKKLTAEGKVFRRVEAPTPADGDASICVKLPAPGHYAMAVLHDRDADGKLDVFSDGFGFPNNPKVRFGSPDVDKVAFEAEVGITKLAITIDYLGGRSASKRQ